VDSLRCKRLHYLMYKLHNSHITYHEIDEALRRQTYVGWDLGMLKKNRCGSIKIKKGTAQISRAIPFKYRKWESNPHTFRYTILSRARLPVPPFRHFLNRCTLATGCFS
jgi:hypothetical protein